ncbi:MAG: thioredoxin domain-containing protein [Patescibacteria group bacterium]|jgi:protein-disulfide isomerase
MDNNYENQDATSNSSIDNSVGDNTFGLSDAGDQQISEQYLAVAVKWYKKGWGKAIIAGMIVIILLLALVVYLIISNFGVDKSGSGQLNNIDNLFTTSSTSAVVSSSSSTVATGVIATVKDSTRLLAEKMDRPMWGNPSSTLVIVEFADFQCSVCEAEFSAIRGFVTKHQDEVLYIFRNYVVIDENSNLLAQASLCAGDQGKFWIFHDKLYTNFGSINSTADLQNLVQSLGLDWNKMGACIQSGKYVSQVSQDSIDGQNLGIVGTPTFFVNGKKLEGAITSADWEAILSKYKQITGQNN